MSEFETTIDGALERITRLLETLAARMATAERQLQTVIDVLPEMQREIEVLHRAVALHQRAFESLAGGEPPAAPRGGLN